MECGRLFPLPRLEQEGRHGRCLDCTEEIAQPKLRSSAVSNSLTGKSWRRRQKSQNYRVRLGVFGAASRTTTAERNEAYCFPKSVATASSNSFSQSATRRRHFRCRRFHAERRRRMVDGLTRRGADLCCADADCRFLAIFSAGPSGGLGWRYR